MRMLLDAGASVNLRAIVQQWYFDNFKNGQDLTILTALFPP